MCLEKSIKISHKNCMPCKYGLRGEDGSVKCNHPNPETKYIKNEGWICYSRELGKL